MWSWTFSFFHSLFLCLCSLNRKTSLHVGSLMTVLKRVVVLPRRWWQEKPAILLIRLKTKNINDSNWLLFWSVWRSCALPLPATSDIKLVQMSQAVQSQSLAFTTQRRTVRFVSDSTFWRHACDDLRARHCGMMGDAWLSSDLRRWLNNNGLLQFMLHVMVTITRQNKYILHICFHQVVGLRRHGVFRGWFWNRLANAADVGLVCPLTWS